jgi:hypothetical protein
MKDANQMTPEELRALADQKEEGEKPIKTGELKHDLYCFDSNAVKYHMNNMEYWMVTKEEVDLFIATVEKLCCSLDLKKGAKFICFLEDGGESWYDDVNYGVEGVGADWAEKHLTNIKKV